MLIYVALFLINTTSILFSLGWILTFATYRIITAHTATL